jgi:DNA polymerase I-like protein with 3'-5' exonuclease and polymerase domains
MGVAPDDDAEIRSRARSTSALSTAWCARSRQQLDIDTEERSGSSPVTSARTRCQTLHRRDHRRARRISRWPSWQCGGAGIDSQIRERASERIAVNTPVQGTAADIIKLAMVSVDREIRARGLSTRMILTVHDELLFDVPRGELEEASALVRDCMEGAMRLRVPLKVDLGTGPNWLEAH